jgi:hypothetical protein
MAVIAFERDDPGFERWLEENPDGYVLNVYRVGRVHTARCKSYRSAGPRLTHSRAKACSSDEQQLFAYAEQHGIDATRCALC